MVKRLYYTSLTLLLKILYYYYFFNIHCVIIRGFPSGSEVKNLPAMQETQEMQIQALCLEDPLEEGMASHSNILA